MGAASFKSLYPKRPAESLRLRAVVRRSRYSTKQGPPRWGGYVTLKLCQSSMAW
jgi:hypothetical protein